MGIQHRGASKDANRGPSRWERAINAARRSPDTYHGKLYRGRFEFADQVGHDDVTLRAWMQRDWSAKTDKVDFYTCSAFCAAMQSHLSAVHLTNHIVHFKNAFVQDVYVPSIWKDATYRWSHPSALFKAVRPHELTRRVRCHVCRRVVKKDGTTDDSNRINFWEQESAEVQPIVIETAGQIIEGIKHVQIEPVRVEPDPRTSFWIDAVGTVRRNTAEREVRLTEAEYTLLMEIPADRRRTLLKTLGIL